ncbi:MAG: hypothetical protein ABSG23_07650 [Terriglobales bacterium]|jgi:hypothetical protein
MKKIVVAWIIGSVVGLYTTFVIQNLWNWFATSALHVPEISFWVMYGLTLLISLFTAWQNGADEPRWKAMGIALEACIPDAKKEEVEAQVKEQLEVRIWVDMGYQVFGKVVGTTFVLALGFVVHLFLA